MKQIIDYYEHVAVEYDKHDLSLERREDVCNLEEICRAELSGRSILEVACGTGRWSRYLAGLARSVVAIDINVRMLAIARERNRYAPNLSFVRGDSYNLPIVDGVLNGGFGGWWLSHVPKQDLLSFLERYHSCLGPGSRVIFADDTESVEEDVCRLDEHGNTYVRRVLSDGRSFEVLKNFYTGAQLRELLKPVARGLSYTEGHCHWNIRYTPRAAGVDKWLRQELIISAKGARNGS